MARRAGYKPLTPDGVSRHSRLSLHSSHYCTWRIANTPEGVLVLLRLYPLQVSSYSFTLNLSYIISYFPDSEYILYRCFIKTYCTHIVSLCPEMSISKFIFQICMSVKYHQYRFSSQIYHKARHTHLRRYTY